jgi:chorismate mutase
MNKQQEIEELEKKLSTLNHKIKDVENRLPAHGIKPPIMTELFELEDERDTLMKQISELKRKKSLDDEVTPRQEAS